MLKLLNSLSMCCSKYFSISKSVLNARFYELMQKDLNWQKIKCHKLKKWRETRNSKNGRVDLLGKLIIKKFYLRQKVKWIWKKVVSYVISRVRWTKYNFHRWLAFNYFRNNSMKFAWLCKANVCCGLLTLIILPLSKMLSAEWVYVV